MNFVIKRCIKDYENVEDLRVRSAYGKLSGIAGIIFNILLFAIKLLAGTLSHSVAITADAFNNLSDASSSIISLAGFKLAAKPADKDHPFGHGRYEYLSGLMVAVLVMAIGIELLKTGIEKVIHPSDVDLSILSFVILGVSILVKLYMMYYNTRIGRMIKSNALIATAKDSRNDCISTGAVLISSIIMKVFGINIDGWLGIAVAVFILISGFGLIKDTLGPLLGQAPDPELVKKIRDIIMAHEHIDGIHDLIVHVYGPGNMFASVHVEVDVKMDPLLAHDEIDNIEREVLDKEGVNLTIHYDPIETDDELTNEVRSFVAEHVKAIDSRITIHDLRVVPGITHTNVVFDVVVPYDIKFTDDEIRSRVDELVKSDHPDFNTVLTIDRDFT